MNATNESEEYPLISAIMLAGRVQLEDILTCIECFKAQTYPYKELIIVNNTKTQYEAATLELQAEKDVFIVDTPTELSAGMARSKSENKTAFVHFYAKWCGPCKIMEKKTFRDPGVIAALNQDFIPIKIDVDRNPKVSKLFKVKAVPDTWLIGTDYRIIHHRSGYITPKQLKALLKIYSED